MENKSKVNIFLVIIAIIALIIAIFAFSRSDHSYPDTSEHEETVRLLSDSIRELKDDIARYRSEIEKLDLEREEIRKRLDEILRDNEKTDSELANGDWDTNIKFLTKFLSKKDSLGK